jgi:hypothetical protein
MPRGANGERRPADANANAVLIGKIATGEVEDGPPDTGRTRPLRSWAGRAVRSVRSP